MNELGNVSISQEVVATIAESVITEIDGVHSLVGSSSKNEITKFFQSVSAGEIQTKVVKAITEMTGLKVQEVNVFIQKVVKDVPEQEIQPKKLPENNTVIEEK